MVRNIVVLLTNASDASTPWRLTQDIELGHGDIGPSVREVVPVTQWSIDASLGKNDSFVVPLLCYTELYVLLERPQKLVSPSSDPNSLNIHKYNGRHQLLQHRHRHRHLIQ